MRGGIDELLSARDRFGEKSVWLDIDEMLTLLENSQRKAGVQSTEFMKGEIEHAPPYKFAVNVNIGNGW